MTNEKSQLDPELINRSIKIVKLYIKAGHRTYPEVLDLASERLDLGVERIHPYIRLAYNHIRDEKQLSKKSIAGMTRAAEVLQETRKRMPAKEVMTKSTSCDDKHKKGLVRSVMEAWKITSPEIVSQWQLKSLIKQAEGMANLIQAEAEAIAPQRPRSAIMEAMSLLLADPPPIPKGRARRLSRAGKN
jgi:hypothetical protein